MSNGRSQLGNAGPFAGNSFHDGRAPVIGPHCQRLHGANLTFHPLRPFAIALVNDENVSNLHNAGLDGLYIVAHAGNKHHHCDVRQPHDINLVLTETHGLNHDQIAP